MKNEKDFYKRRMILEWHLPHIRKVQDYMVLLELNRNDLPFYIQEWELLYRGMKHDVDKLSPKNAGIFLDAERYFYDEENNIKNDLNLDIILKDICDSHYNKQRHHTKYHDINGGKISNLDLCEMACDHLAATEKYGKPLSECLDYYRCRKEGECAVIAKSRDKEYVYLVNLVRLLKIKERFKN